MRETRCTGSVVRFGTFEVDLAARELRKHGLRVKLQGQPFQVLQVLLKHPGEIVTREELRLEIWPPDTFVDFEHGLHNAIKKVRAALGDSHGNPRYIETIPKSGYRFIAAIHSVTGGGAGPIPDVTGVGKPKHSVITAIAMGGMAIALIALSVVYPRLRRSGAKRPSFHSLAVLPLRNLSVGPREEYFADAMTEELINELSGIRALNVISRTSVMRYKGSTEPLPDIARELHVEAVVEGSVVRSGGRVRITAQLIDASSDSSIWAQTFDRELKDVLAVQAIVARAIAEAVQARITAQESSRLANVHPLDREAIESYVEGRYCLDKARAMEYHKGMDRAYEQELRNAVAAFERAIRKEPNYIAPYLAINEATNIGIVPPPPEFIPKARAAVTKALELDDLLVEAHLAQASFLELWEWDWPGVARELKRAIELNPNSADAHLQYSDYLHLMLREDEARAEAGLAQMLDPKHNLKGGFGFSEGWTLERKREYLDTHAPDDGFSRGELAKEFQLAGRYKEAIEEWAKCMTVFGYSDSAAILRRGSKNGNYKQALRNWMNKEERDAEYRYVPSFLLAFIYSNLGDKDRAFRWLEQARKEHQWCLWYLQDDPIWNPIRSDRRFVTLEQRVGLLAQEAGRR